MLEPTCDRAQTPARRPNKRFAEKRLSINSMKRLDFFTELTVMKDHRATINWCLLAKHISEPIAASSHPESMGNNTRRCLIMSMAANP